MPNIINNIKPNCDDYRFDSINCFEKSVGISLNHYNVNYSGYFYMFIELIKSYNVLKYSKKNNNEIDIAKKLLENVFKIKLNKVMVNGDISKVIEEQINNNNPVLVPGNLIGLYYSYHYKLSSWEHLFLIKGFDETRRIYYILDNLQMILDTGHYYDFVMDYNQLQEIYDLSENEAEIYYIERNNPIPSVKDTDIVISFIDLYINYLDKQPFKVIDIIDKYNSQIKESDPSLKDELDITLLTKNLANMPKYKDVMFKELLRSLNAIGYPQKSIEEIATLIEELINKWFSLINNSIKNIYKKTLISYDDKLKDILIYENQLINQLKECLDFYQDVDMLQENNKTISSEKQYYYENNLEDIITEIENNISFKFNTKNTYPSWSVDNCPKLVFKDRLEISKQYYIQSSVKIHKDSKETGYHGGIFIRTEKNQRYCWGINSGLSLRLDQAGINDNIKDVPINNTNLTLFVNVCNSNCQIGYIDEDTNEQYLVGEYVLDSNIKSLGLSCKTWGNGQLLIAEFSNYKLSEKG